jgi:hypothetical protein
VTLRDYAILKLLDEAIERRDADAMTSLWRRFANWHGLNPDIAVVMQEHQAQVKAGLSTEERVRAIVAEQHAPKTIQ